ncbi:MAG: hypothetical protein WC734_01215 [Patescibacteria group bacterium]|jgi:DNA-directed RNA polymerase subunit RPC12/RpoP
MPIASDYRCNKCSFNIPETWGGYMYVIDESNKRVPCSHPGESYTVAEVLKIDEELLGICTQWEGGYTASVSNTVSEEQARSIIGKIGYNSDYICLNCSHRFYIDTKKDKKLCPQCKSDGIEAILDMAGKTCPKCKDGTIDKFEEDAIS